MTPTVPIYPSDEPGGNVLFTETHTTSSDNLTSLFEGLVNISEPETAHEKSYWDYDIFWTGYWIFQNSWKIVAPPGILGNRIILIVVLKMKPFNSTSLFVVSLAVLDLAIICMRIAFKEVLFTTTTICRTMWYLYIALPLFSNYILVFWTIERLIAVKFPLRVMEWCTVKRTTIAIAAAGVFSFSLNIAWPVNMVLRPGGYGCTVYAHMFEFIVGIWFKVDTSIFLFIPMITILICNIMIICRLKQSTKRHRQMTSNEESRKKREKEQRNTTISLLSVSFAFLILYIPLAVYNCLAMTTIVMKNQEAVATWDFINYFAHTVGEVQNSVNFYLYFLSGRRYREITFTLFVPCRTTSTSKQNNLESFTNRKGVSSITNDN